MATLVDFINLLLDKQDLSFEQAQELMDLVFSGEISEVQIAAFLTALRAKGGDHGRGVRGWPSSLRSHAVKVETSHPNLVDVVGTGGAAIKTFNVSTASAIVTAGAGVSVAKHGNRGITSKCGAGDVLEALGVKIDVGPEVVTRCIEQAGHRFYVCPHVPPGHEIRATRAQGPGLSHGVQYSGTASQSCRGNHAVVGRGRCRIDRHDGRGFGACGSPAGHGGP